MSLFRPLSAVAILEAVVIGRVLNSENFSSSIDNWTWNTPGVDDPGQAWSRGLGDTPSNLTGPSGGADPETRAVVVSNPYAYTETTSGNLEATSEPSFTMESPVFDARAGRITLTFDIHARWTVTNEGAFFIEGWNGSSWSSVGPSVNRGLQSADLEGDLEDYVASSALGTYDSRLFSNTDFKFRFRLTRTPGIAGSFQYDTAIDNVIVTTSAS